MANNWHQAVTNIAQASGVYPHRCRFQEFCGEVEGFPHYAYEGLQFGDNPVLFLTR